MKNLLELFGAEKMFIKFLLLAIKLKCKFIAPKNHFDF